MIIEHPHIGDPYSAEGMWFIHQAHLDFVVSASWAEVQQCNDMFNGPSRHKQIIRKICAESDNLDELKKWVTEQQPDIVVFYRTWEMLDGRRDNAQITVEGAN